MDRRVEMRRGPAFYPRRAMISRKSGVRGIRLFWWGASLPGEKSDASEMRPYLKCLRMELVSCPADDHYS